MHTGRCSGAADPLTVHINLLSVRTLILRYLCLAGEDSNTVCSSVFHYKKNIELLEHIQR